MGVGWYWHERHERIAVIEYSGEWTWLDNDIILSAIGKQIKARGYDKIDFVSYLHKDAVMPDGVVARGIYDSSNPQEHTGLVVFVGMRGQARSEYEKARDSIKGAPTYMYQLADTVRQAVQIIVANRQPNKINRVKTDR